MSVEVTCWEIVEGGGRLATVAGWKWPMAFVKAGDGGAFLWIAAGLEETVEKLARDATMLALVTAVPLPLFVDEANLRGNNSLIVSNKC